MDAPYVELLQDLPVVRAADFQGLIAPPYFEPDSEGYVTLSDKGQLGVMQWPTPGLKLNFN